VADNVWRILISIVVAAHGIGHVLFLVSTFGLADWGQSAHSWLLTNAVGDVATRAIGTIIWFVAVAGFLAAAVGIWTEMEWWRTAAIVSSIVSIIGLVLFWSNPAGGPTLSALVFDIVILVALVILRWPPSTLVGA
jgi:hypothetical protein